MKISAIKKLLPLIPLLLFGCSKNEEPAPLIRPVRTMRVAESTLQGGRVFPGRAEAVLAVDIAFEVAGQLNDRPIQVGDQVAKGDVLAKLNPRDFENDVNSSKARLKQAQAYLERIEKAAKSGAVSQQDLTDAQAQFDVAQADLEIKQKALNETQIIAPFDGTVSAIYAENFENVLAKQRIVRLMDITTIEMKVDIPEKIISYIKTVETITVTFDAFPDHPVPATIKEIGKEASASTRTFPVTLAMEQPENFVILPGMTGQASGSGSTAALEEGVNPVAPEAVFEEAGKSYVWIFDETSSTVKKTPVEIHEVNRSGLMVRGLEKGQVVVTAGTHSLSEGQEVRLLKETQL